MKYTFCFLFLFLVSFTCITGETFQYGAFDPAYWNGLVLLKEDNVFAFRFVFLRDKVFIDGYDTFHIVERVGPFAPDGSFGEMSFNPFLPLKKGHQTPILAKKTPIEKTINLQYAKYKSGVIGKIYIPENVGIQVIFYNPWKQAVNYQQKGTHILGNHKGIEFSFIPVTSGFEAISIQKNELKAVVKRGSRCLLFYAGFGSPLLSNKKIEAIIIKNKREYNSRRPKVEGQWQGVISSISDNIAWMKLYQPDKKRIYLPAGRRWIFPKPDGTRDIWTIFEWDAFFNAIEAVIEDRDLARHEIEAVLDTQYPNGNIPNWRSAFGGTPDRSQPPVGSYAILKTYYRTKDTSLLANSYERLKKWHEFWKSPGRNGNPRRDGNRDGLLEWGSDSDLLFQGMPKWEQGASGRQRAAWESGEDDLPNFDGVAFDEVSGTLKMNCIDLSSLYALDAEILKEIATILGRTGDARKFQQEYKYLQGMINQKLWHKDFYFDRFWDGTFSSHKAASNFYPMLAGIPDQQQVKKMIARLLSEKEFWGDFIIPTISRDNLAYKDQQYWRGTIWPPTNYLVYQGLKRYRLDRIASEFAVKSASLFLKSWKVYGLCRENYNSITGEGGGQRYQSWGPLFAMILLEDFIDITPFEGFRVGNLSASELNEFKNINLQKSNYTLIADRETLQLDKDNKKLFRFKGKAVLRHLCISKNVLKFEAHVVGESLDFFPDCFRGIPLEIESSREINFKKKSYLRIPVGITTVTLRKKK
jgi:hypothetical protein